MMIDHDRGNSVLADHSENVRGSGWRNVKTLEEGPRRILKSREKINLGQVRCRQRVRAARIGLQRRYDVSVRLRIVRRDEDSSPRRQKRSCGAALYVPLGIYSRAHDHGECTVTRQGDDAE